MNMTISPISVRTVPSSSLYRTQFHSLSQQQAIMPLFSVFMNLLDPDSSPLGAQGASHMLPLNIVLQGGYIVYISPYLTCLITTALDVVSRLMVLPVLCIAT